MLSKAVKNCLVACWRQRAYLRGDQNECEPLGWKVFKPRPAAKNIHTTSTDPDQQSQDMLYKYWQAWSPKPKDKWENKKTKQYRGRANFFVVIEGRTKGVFYKWRDCWRSVAGYDNPQFKGYKTLAQAYNAAAKIKTSH